MKRVCVFADPASVIARIYRDAAIAMGTVLAAKGIGLVYGGGNVGLMGVVADAVLAGGGDVIGVIPQSLADRESRAPRRHRPARRRLDAHAQGDDGRSRRRVHCDAGGVGTFEEFFEAVTWTQLGVHRKPCGLLNAGEFYTPLAAFIDQAVTEGFIKPVHRGIIVCDEDPGRLLDKLANVTLPDVAKWIRKDERTRGVKCPGRLLHPATQLWPWRRLGCDRHNRESSGWAHVFQDQRRTIHTKNPARRWIKNASRRSRRVRQALLERRSRRNDLDAVVRHFAPRDRC
jgi:predicted Rossmann-fold nucleotide-binding protein